MLGGFLVIDALKPSHSVIKTDTMITDYIKPTTELFDSQKQFVNKLVRRAHTILSGKTGEGKTLSCLYAFAWIKDTTSKRYNNLLILAPLSAHKKHVWATDVKKFTNMSSISLDEFTDRVHNGEDIDTLLQKYDVIYGKHTHVKTLAKEVIKYIVSKDAIVCLDECHTFRNPKADLTIQTREALEGAKAVWGITATTISTNIENLYNIVNFIYPKYLGTWTAFRNEYCKWHLENIYVAGGARRKVVKVDGILDEAKLWAKLEPVYIAGKSFFDLHFHYLDYELDEYESTLYTKITNGLTMAKDEDPEVWFQNLFHDKYAGQEVPHLGSLERFSSRFIYLQYACDGIIDEDGTYLRGQSSKFKVLLAQLKEIIDKKQSVLVYFDYHASVATAEKLINYFFPSVRCLKSTGTHVLKDTDVTEKSVKNKPHVILCTRASAESASYYFINNVIFFHIPTVPSTFVQFVGRITRKNSLYPDDLHVYILRSRNIDLYKLVVVSTKTCWMEDAAGGTPERNVPEEYKRLCKTQKDLLETAKQVLLWRKPRKTKKDGVKLSLM